MTTSTVLDRCVVIGGGVGGCCSALELADAGFTVELIEKESELMNCASNVTPGRMGLGFHYSHLETACFYLRATVRFARQFGHFRDAAEKPSNHPRRRGRYFILKCSKVPPDDILKTYQGIQQEYAKLVAKDPRNEVFGPPENVFRILEEREFADDVPVEIVKYGIETAEGTLNWIKFKKHLIEKILEQMHLNRIRVHLSTEVTDIRQLCEGLYCINCVSHTESSLSSQQLSLVTGRLVNSTWENIAALNSTTNLKAKARVNRVKAIATVQLPPEMEHAHSMFFCMGPHCMLTNKGNGIGKITFAPVTNVGLFTTDVMPPELQNIMHNMTADEKISVYGNSILEGASRYIPKLASAKILKVETGIVQTLIKGDHFVPDDMNSIHDPSSSAGIYYRNYSGVEIVAPGFVVNACMKLLFCTDNAKAVRKFFTKDKKRSVLSNNNMHEEIS